MRPVGSHISVNSLNMTHILCHEFHTKCSCKFFFAPGYLLSSFHFLYTTGPGRCVWFLKPGICESSTASLGKIWCDAVAPFEKKLQLYDSSLSLSITWSSFAKRPSAFSSKIICQAKSRRNWLWWMLYWRRSIWKSSHANAFVQVGHFLKDNPAQLVSLYSLGRGYGAVVVTMLMSRPLLEDLALFRRDLFRNKPCNKLEMPGGSEWNCPKCRSSLCVGILEDEVLI